MAGKYYRLTAAAKLFLDKFERGGEPFVVHSGEAFVENEGGHFVFAKRFGKRKAQAYVRYIGGSR